MMNKYCIDGQCKKRVTHGVLFCNECMDYCEMCERYCHDGE